MQVWFQNARAKFRRTTIKNSESQDSPSVTTLPTHHHHHHHQDAVAAAAAEMQKSVDDINSESPVSGVSLLDLQTSTINSSSSSSNVIISADYEQVLSPSVQCSVPALADILCCPSFTL